MSNTPTIRIPDKPRWNLSGKLLWSLIVVVAVGAFRLGDLTHDARDLKESLEKHDAMFVEVLRQLRTQGDALIRVAEQVIALRHDVDKR